MHKGGADAHDNEVLAAKGLQLVSSKGAKYMMLLLLLLLCIAGLRYSSPSFPASRMGSPTTLSYYVVGARGLPLGRTD